jgi:hypothetical protein
MKQLFVVFVMLIGFTEGVHAASLPADLIVTGNSGAWEWVWVSPCAEVRENCSLIPGVEALYGFSAPTSDVQWTTSFTGYADLLAQFMDFTTTTPVARCAAPFFSQDFTECNIGDLQAGAVWHAPFLPATFVDNDAAELFWLRAAVATPPSVVSEPSTGLLMSIVACLFICTVWRAVPVQGRLL